MSTAPMLYAPAMRQASHDRRLTFAERTAVVVLWHHLDTREYRPMKTERLATLLGVKRESAARILRHLVGCGYVLCTVPDDRSTPRQFLLVNTVTAPAA